MKKERRKIWEPMRIVSAAFLLMTLFVASVNGQSVQIRDMDLTIQNTPEPQRMTFKLPTAESDDDLGAVAESNTDLMTMEVADQSGMVVVTARVLSQRDGEIVLFNPEDEFTFHGLLVKVAVLPTRGAKRLVLKALDLPEAVNPTIDLGGRTMLIAEVLPDGRVRVVTPDNPSGRGRSGFIRPSSEGRFVLLVTSEAIGPWIWGSLFAIFTAVLVVYFVRQSKGDRTNDQIAVRRNDQVTVRSAPLAIWSLVLAIVGLLLIGPLGTIPAVICGHMALPRINRSSGTLTGKGMAIAGLIIGYVGIILHLVILPMLLLPAMSVARERAWQVQCINNLKQISLAVETYSWENQGRLPPDLQSLRKYADEPNLFVCPATRHQPGEMALVDQWSDYVLVPNRKESDHGDTVLAFSKPECYPGKGGNILFVDGHVRWCPLYEYRRLTEGLLVEEDEVLFNKPSEAMPNGVLGG